jgi:hypothetical protein
LGAGVEPTRDEQRRERQGGRHGEEREGRVVTGAVSKDEGDGQGAEHGSRLVHRLPQAESPPAPHRRGGVRQHRVAGRLPDGAARALEHDQAGRRRPMAGEGEERYGEQVDRVAHEAGRPVSFRAIGEQAGAEAKAVAEQLAEAAHGSDNGGRRAETGQEWAGHAPRTFVSHVGEEAHEPDQHDEPHRCGRADVAAVRGGGWG